MSQFGNMGMKLGPDGKWRKEVVVAGTDLSTAPMHGAKTVSTVAAELFAGSSRLEGRHAMAIYNESPTTVYWGRDTVTTANGFPLHPGDYALVRFDKGVATPIYAVASANSEVRVVELA